jgi:signal peptidase I
VSELDASGLLGTDVSTDVAGDDVALRTEPVALQPGEPREPESVPAQPDPTFEKVLRWILEAVVIVSAAFLLALLIQMFILKPFVIPSESMEPTLDLGDRVLVNRLVYHFREPERGDIIVFDPPVESDEPFIKRVVAIGGDTVSVQDGKLWVNGEAQTEPYLNEPEIFEDFAEVTVPEGSVWAMGDNRNNSGDSRRFGPVSVRSIIGEAFAIYWPRHHWRGL